MLHEVYSNIKGEKKKKKKKKLIIRIPQEHYINQIAADKDRQKKQGKKKNTNININAEVIWEGIHTLFSRRIFFSRCFLTL